MTEGAKSGYYTYRMKLLLTTFILMGLTACGTVSQSSGFSPAAPTKSRLGLLSSLKLNGEWRPETKKLCANVSLFGFGPEICIGWRSPIPNKTPTPEDK